MPVLFYPYKYCVNSILIEPQIWFHFFFFRKQFIVYLQKENIWTWPKIKPKMTHADLHRGWRSQFLTWPWLTSFRDSTPSLPVNTGVVLEVRSWQLPSPSCPVCFLPFIWCHTLIYSELLDGLSKSERNWKFRCCPIMLILFLYLMSV